MSTDMLESLGHEMWLGNDLSFDLGPMSCDEANDVRAADANDDSGLHDMPSGIGSEGFPQVRHPLDGRRSQLVTAGAVLPAHA